MWNIRKEVSKGDYIYAVVPEHPKATKNHYVLMHRVVMENFLGRMLKDNEVVHHIDHNKKNNDISNLELMDKALHVEMHSKEQGRQMVKLICPWCKKEFIAEKRCTHLQKPSKYHCTCCCRSCRGKLYRYIQMNRVTSAIRDAINNNVVASYKRYLS